VAPLQQLAGVLTESAQQHALDLLAGRTLADALAGGLPAVRERVATGLIADSRLGETGVEVVGVRVVAIRPEPDLERALQTPVRERVQQDADRATYERRAVAVQRERAIAENELQNQIELARQEEQLVAQRGANARRQAEEAAAADRIEAEAQAARTTTVADARAQVIRVEGAAQAEAEKARLEAYSGADPTLLLALAVRELATNLPTIEHLTLTPDLLARVLARLGHR